MIDVFCSMPHYARHIRPIHDALPSEHRGEWFDAYDDPAGGDVVVVGAYRDLRWLRGRYRRYALIEHGIGQSYITQPDHPAYPGGNRDPYDLLLAPGRHVVDQAAAETVCVGSPFRGPGRAPAFAVAVEPSRFAVSYHWDAGIAPESDTTFWEHLPHLQDQAERLEGGLLVHAHPRIQDEVFTQIKGKPGLEPCVDFDEVKATAKVFAVDNSSVLYEFAALDRPVVVVNSYLYRRHVDHGKRFWEWADVGEQIDHPGNLAEAMLRADAYDPHAARRREIVGEVYEGNTQDGVTALVRLAGC